MFQGKTRKVWELRSTYAVAVMNKVSPLMTRYVLTTHNTAKKLGKISGRRKDFVCFMYYNDKVTDEKPNYEQSCKFSVVG